MKPVKPATLPNFADLNTLKNTLYKTLILLINITYNVFSKNSGKVYVGNIFTQARAFFHKPIRDGKNGNFSKDIIKSTKTVNGLTDDRLCCITYFLHAHPVWISSIPKLFVSFAKVVVQ